MKPSTKICTHALWCVFVSVCFWMTAHVHAAPPDSGVSPSANQTTPVQSRPIPRAKIAVPKSIASAIDPYQKALPGTGWILCLNGPSKIMVGTCWLVDARQRLVVTNNHVVAGASEVRVFFPERSNGRAISEPAYYLQKRNYVVGNVIATDPKVDLAIVKLAYLPPGVAELSLAPASGEVGRPVLYIGNSAAVINKERGPLWKSNQGTVLDSRFIVGKLDNGGLVEARLVKLSVGVRPGDSGSPVVDEKGRLVAVIVSGAPSHSFAIDVSEVRHFLDKIRNGEATPVAKSLVGRWKAMLKSNGEDRVFSVTFEANGAMVLDGAKVLKGTYHSSDTSLNWSVPEARINEGGAVEWVSAARFVATIQGQRITFDRR